MSTTFANQINGNDIYAKRAECDAAGNTLSTTYAKTADLATVATSGDWDDLSDKPTILGMVAGSNVTITEGNDSITIAATDTTYSAGTGLSLSGTTFSNSDPLPAHTSTESGKVLGVDSNGDLDWVNQSGGGSTYTAGTGIDITSDVISVDTATVAMKSDIPSVPVTDVTVDGTSVVSSGTAAITMPTVDQTYDGTSTNAQSGTAVAQAISSVDGVPDVTSSDNGKVLLATYSGGTGSYAWASTPPANAIILDSSSTWSDFHTPYSAGRKDIYYKHTSPNPPLESRAELYLQLTAVSDVDGSSTNYTYALFEGAWQSASVDYAVKCKFRYSGNPIVFLNTLTVDQSYSSSSTSAQSGVAVAQAISAVNQVPSSTSVDEGKVLTVDSNGEPEWATAQAPISAGNGIDITNNVVSVDTSVVATQTDLAGKEDSFTVGTGLEMDTTGGVNTLQVEAPVDIVAGPGIAIDNPDGNTMRVTNIGYPISETDAVLCGTFKGDPMYMKTYTFTGTVGTSETTIAMSIDEKKGTDGVNRIWIDPSNSFVVYGSAGNNFLPISWRLASGRQGSVGVLGATSGSLSCRCVDTSSTPLTFNITIRYTVSA